MSAARGKDAGESKRAADGERAGVGALSGGADAVLVVAITDAGAIRTEFANETARALLALTDPAGGTADDVVDDARVPGLAPLLARLRNASTRERATRERVALVTPAGPGIDVDVQMEPLPKTAESERRVLAVVRVAEGPGETDAATPATATRSGGVFRTELGLGAVFVDDAVLAVLGLSHEQALGYGWLDALHPDDRGAVGEAFERGDAGEESVHLECRVLRGAVDERLVQVRAVPVRGDEGRVTGYLGSIEDMTDDDRDRTAGARLAELAGVLDEWIAIVDAGLDLQYANPAACRDLALPALDELGSVALAQLLDTARQPAIVREIGDAIASTGVWSGDLVLRALDGRPVEADCTIVAHRAPDGTVAHYSLLGRDVSALRGVERALRESEERFRLIAESSPSGIYLVVDGGEISYANQALATILGEDVDRLIGRSFLEWIHPDDLGRIVESGTLLAAQQREADNELRIRRPSGEVRWLRARGAPVVDGDGVVKGWVGVVVDVTSERAARVEMEMLVRAVESTRDLVSFHDADGTMIFANAATRELFGIPLTGPVPPLRPTEYIDATPDAHAEIAQQLMTKGQWSGELVLRNAQGRRTTVSVGVIAHYDAHGELDYFSSLGHDLTEQQQTNAARRRSEAALRAIVQSSPLAIFAFDVRGVVHVWNRASADVFGWPDAEVIGNIPPFLDDDAAEEFDRLRERVFDGHTVRGHRARYHRRDGTLIEADLSIAPLRNPAGRVVTAVAVLADVTEQTRATQALVESEVWFRSLVQHSNDMVMVLADDASVTYASPSARAFAGVVGVELSAIRVTEIVRALDEDLAPLQDAFLRMRAQPGATERVSFRSRRADGAVRWIELAATNLLDNPAVRGIVVNGRDVTASVEAEASARASEERLRELVSSVSDAIVVVGAGGETRYSSPVADEMFIDLSGGERDGVFASVHPDDLPRAIELWEQTRATPGVSPPGDVRLLRRDGSVLEAEVVANNLLHDPAVDGIVMTIRDVTARNASERALRESEARLRESEARYRAVVDDQIELVCRYAPDTTIQFVNRAFAEFYGRSPSDLIGSKLIELHPPSERPAELGRLASFGPGNEVQTYDDWEFAGDGSGRWYRWTDRAFLDDAGHVVEFQSVGHDVTEEHRASVLTTNQADILEQVARGVPLEETLRAIARTVESHFPRLQCAMFLLEDGATLRLGAAPHLPRRFAAALDGMSADSGSGSCVAAAKRREPVYVEDATRDPLWAELRDTVDEHDIRQAWSTPILGSDGRNVLGTVAVFGPEPGRPDGEHRRLFSLVAHLASIAIERKAFEDRLAHESMHDPLTGLPNRLLFLDRLALAIARGRRTRAGVAVLFLDLDRFKNVNDSLGHDAGDELLVAVAHRLDSVLRPGDTVARFGGDEFTILCEDLPVSDARERAVEIAHRLLGAVARPFVVRTAETFVGVSVGIALTATGEESPEDLLRDADAAMYHAKDAGRGRVEVFDDTMRARALARHATENALHRAIERGELRLFFQPIVSIERGECIGAESLVRWQHPERGLVLPAEFVPLAEETGLIVPLGHWVLEQAASQAAIWQAYHDGDFVVSVNLSARQVAEPALVEQVAEVIAKTGVRPENLCFEITETVLMGDADAVMRVVERVRALGVRFAIDDFGTGYSSLGYLKRFSVDTVKIDRAFVDGLDDDDGDRAIVSAVIGLGHALGLRVVAEGVEREAQLAELVALGCDEAQGYFFSPPQPAEDFSRLVTKPRRWRPPGSPLMGRST